MFSTTKTLLAATAALAITAGAATAAPATVTTNLNVRSGPGTGYAVIAALPVGSTVNVIGCTGAWCEVALGRGETGFASESYLERDELRSSRVIVEEDEPEIVTGLSIGGYYDSRPYYYNDGFYYYGGRWYGERPGYGDWRRSWRRDYRWRGRDRAVDRTPRFDDWRERRVEQGGWRRGRDGEGRVVRGRDDDRRDWRDRGEERSERRREMNFGGTEAWRNNREDRGGRGRGDWPGDRGFEGQGRDRGPGDRGFEGQGRGGDRAERGGRSDNNGFGMAGGRGGFEGGRGGEGRGGGIRERN